MPDHEDVLRAALREHLVARALLEAVLADAEAAWSLAEATEDRLRSLLATPLEA